MKALFCILAFSSTCFVAHAEEPAFKNEITCTLNHLNERVVLEPFFNVKYTATAQCGLGADCEDLDGFDGNNYGDHPGRFYRPSTSPKFYNDNPKRSPIFASGFISKGNPLRSFTVYVIASEAFNQLKYKNEPRYQRLLAKTVTRPEYEYFYTAHKPFPIPDAKFTAKAMVENGGSQTLNVPIVDPQSLRIVNENITCSSHFEN